MADVLDRIPELQDLVVEVLAFLMELHDDESMTVTDVAAHIPELDHLVENADFFLEELDKDSVSVAVEFWTETLGETDEYEAAGWIESGRGSVFVPYQGDEADD
jgi:hypothetical protein